MAAAFEIADGVSSEFELHLFFPTREALTFHIMAISAVPYSPRTRTSTITTTSTTITTSTTRLGTSGSRLFGASEFQRRETALTVDELTRCEREGPVPHGLCLEFSGTQYSLKSGEKSNSPRFTTTARLVESARRFSTGDIACLEVPLVGYLMKADG